MKQFSQRSISRLLTAVFTVLVFGIQGAFFPAQAAQAAPAGTCAIHSPAGNAKHVIYIQFDNVHFTRDNPNVPSDLEQMPTLLNFMKNNGTLLSNHHTPLIAHTATDILTSLTGVYGSKHGVPISNSYRYYNPDGTTSGTGAFGYWTSPVGAGSDTNYNMLSAPNTNAPAPWVPYTRAGCNVGSIATANTVLENTGNDVNTIFGPNSPEATEVKTNPGQAYNDFVGIAVHCAQGSTTCASQNAGRPDILPNEPGGYTGYNALFGHKYVAPQINPNGPLTDLNGNVIKDSTGNIGFPGFDGMNASTSLSYVAAMQEHNIPVTYAYVSDAHDPHSGTNATTYGPGSAGYVAALKSYDNAFSKFFTRLAQDGINKDNTLFVFTSDENDHFVGGKPTPANCNGVTVPCTYSQIGEINTNMAGLLATQQGITTPFTVHADSAPVVYFNGNPARNAPVTRTFEQATAKLTAINPLTGKNELITNYLADPVELNLLHMITADPARTPTFVQFAKPDYFLFAGPTNCTVPCISENPNFAWNHGDVSPDINTTWLGLVGPGVKHKGVDHSVWSDHTDIRPTMLLLLGLRDDYSHDGRVLFEVLKKDALPDAVRDHLSFYIDLAELYKQINAPVGALGLETLKISTQALASSSPNDVVYTSLEALLQNITTQRNAIASQMISVLEAVEFGGARNTAVAQAQTDSNAQNLLQQGTNLFKQLRHQKIS